MEILKDVHITDRGVESVKYFVHDNVRYEDLIKCVEVLERLDGVMIVMEANNLEQSFIALNMD